MSRFQVSDITAGYSRKKILDALSFEVDGNKMIGILGENGCGKTTLLKSICNIIAHEGRCTLIDSSENDIIFEKLSAKALAGICGYIPQRSGISIDISVLDVVLMGFNPELGLLEYPDSHMRSAALKMLELVGLVEHRDRNYQELSEGQKQLCIIARTLVAERRLLLLDEPESSLDYRHRYQVLELLKKWVVQKDRYVFIALHDPSLALNFCDQLLLMKHGYIVEQICPNEDGLDDMEKKLEQIYGPVSLTKYENRAGTEQMVILKEPDR